MADRYMEIAISGGLKTIYGRLAGLNAKVQAIDIILSGVYDDAPIGDLGCELFISAKNVGVYSTKIDQNSVDATERKFMDAAKELLLSHKADAMIEIHKLNQILQEVVDVLKKGVAEDESVICNEQDS